MVEYVFLPEETHLIQKFEWGWKKKIRQSVRLPLSGFGLKKKGSFWSVRHMQISFFFVNICCRMNELQDVLCLSDERDKFDNY